MPFCHVQDTLDGRSPYLWVAEIREIEKVLY
jgi:hypothetical protein